MRRGRRGPARAILGDVEKATAPPPHRRPPALLPPSAARLGGFAALALLGALQWQRMVVDSRPGRRSLWVMVGGRRGGRGAVGGPAPPVARHGDAARGGVGRLGGYASPACPLALLKPRRLDELGAGLSHGAEALASVKMPYEGRRPVAER